MKTLTTIAILILTLTTQAKTYIATGNGKWTDASIWSEMPGAKIEKGDEVIVKGEILMNVHLTVEGLLVIDNNASVISNKDLTISNEGHFENYGNMVVRNIINSGVVTNNRGVEATNDFNNNGTVINNNNLVSGNDLNNNYGNVSGNSGTYFINNTINTRGGEFGNNVKVLIGEAKK